MGIAAGRDADAVPGLRGLRPGRAAGCRTSRCLLDKTGELLRRDYDWSAESGEDHRAGHAGLRGRRRGAPAHMVEFYALLGGGLRDANWDGWLRPVARLAMLPGHAVRPLRRGRPAAAVIPFLDAPSLEPPPPSARDLPSRTAQSRARAVV